MRFIVIDPAKKTVMPVNMDDIRDAYGVVGLDPGRVDHGTIAPGVSIVVYEYSLYVKPKDQHWFAIGRNLFGGGAVLYGYNEMGETVDVKGAPPVLFLRDGNEVERAIESGQIDRPQMAINGEVLWEWPQEQPDVSKR